MDVTKYNFNELLVDIEAAIEESTFLAIDGEFTGLEVEGCNRIAPFDTPEERYSKVKNGSSDFLLVQFGLCAFSLNIDTQVYEAKPFNFYLFPTPASRRAPDRRFLCQSSSIDFLVSHGFDFNKLFREGISYLSSTQEQKLRSELENKHTEANNRSLSLTTPDRPKNTPVPVTPEHKEFVTGICEKINAFVESEEAEELDLPSLNAFQRKLVYQTVEEKYPLVHVETKTGAKKERYLVIHKVKDAEELARKEQEKQAVEMMEFDAQVGFTKVIQAIAKSQKLVVGHNMLLDVLHSVSHFYGPVPDDLDGFKEIVKEVYPRLLDTKLLASTNPFKDYMSFTSLDDVWKTVQNKPFSPVNIKSAPGFDRYAQDKPYHEAGYDAYVTGSCFATMCKFLGKFQDPATEFLLPTSNTIEPFVNKLFLMRIQDIPYLNLSGPDIEVSREHVFHVTFPNDWRASDLHNLFDPFGNVQISWLSDTTAYVGLLNKKYSKLALQSLTEQQGLFRVISYAVHNASKHRKLSSTGIKRKIHTDGDTDSPANKTNRNLISVNATPNSSLKEATSQQCDQTPPQKRPKNEKKVSEPEGKLFDESPSW